MKKYTHVTIDRKKWYRGKTGDSSRLRLRNGKQCCLGFAARELGAKPRQILDTTYPGMLNFALPGLNKRVEDYYEDTVFSEQAAKINDDSKINDDEREKQLKALARQNGFIFKFCRITI